MPQHDDRLIVRQQRLESDGVLSLELEHSDRLALPPWEPGAHIDIVLPSGTIRQYSLCGDPANTTTYRIAVLEEKAGRGGSREVHRELRVGHTVRIRGPRNHFALAPAKHYVLIAGGIGITPVLAMARHLVREGASWSMLYGGRTRRSMAFIEEVEVLGPNVTIAPQDEVGFLDLNSALENAPEGSHVYCCGPGRLIDAVRESCTANLGAESMHAELFGSPPKAEPDGADDIADGEFEVELRQTGCTLTVPADRTLLEVVREVNSKVLFSCEDGFCGSCETKVIEGVPEHRDSILSEADRAKNESMMICVGRSRSPKLVLDA